MKKAFMSIIALMTAVTMSAIDDNTVLVTYNGASATVEIASNIKNYVTATTNGAHVSIVQGTDIGDRTGEIYYTLAGSSTDGAFYMEGSYKASLILEGLTLTNPSGPAINIQNGKRINVSIKNGTDNTLTDGANGDWKGCYVCKGHTEFKGKGTLTVNGNTAHGIWGNEYVEVKNCTINIPNAVKDGINCNQYFLMESGSVTITRPGDDGIQVSYKSKTTDDPEDTGCFTQTDGILSITGHGGVCIKVDNTITYSGGTQNFNTSDVIEHAATGISSILQEEGLGIDDAEAIYDLGGRKHSKETSLPKGVYILKKGKQVTKVQVQ